MKRIIVIGAIIGALISGGAVLLNAAPSVDPLLATPTSIAINVETDVRATIHMNDPLVIQASVTLFRVDDNDHPIETLGPMHDDGTEGDITASDGVFTKHVSL